MSATPLLDSAPAAARWSAAGEGIALSVATRVGAVGLGFVNGVLLARLLGAESRGAFALCVLYADLAATLGAVGLHEAVAVHTAKGSFPPSTTFRTASALGVLGALVAGALAAALLAGGVLEAAGAGALLACVALAAVPGLRLHHVLGAFLRGRGEFPLFNLLQIARPVAMLALTGALVAGIRLGLAGAVLAFVGAALLPAIAAFAHARRRFPGGGRDPACARALLGFGVRTWPGALATALGRRIDFLLLAWFVPAAEVGRYAVATQLAEVLLLVPAGATMVLLPLTASHARGPGLPAASRRWLFATSARHVALCAAALGLGIVAGRSGIARLFGPEFADAIVPFLWLVPGIGFAGIALLLHAVLSGAGRPGSSVIGSTAGLAVGLAAYLLLVPSLGIRGAAIGSTIAYAAQAGFLGWIALRIHRR